MDPNNPQKLVIFHESPNFDRRIKDLWEKDSDKLSTAKNGTVWKEIQIPLANSFEEVIIKIFEVGRAIQPLTGKLIAL
jgi:hypothetical protein